MAKAIDVAVGEATKMLANRERHANFLEDLEVRLPDDKGSRSPIDSLSLAAVLLMQRAAQDNGFNLELARWLPVQDVSTSSKFSGNPDEPGTGPQSLYNTLRLRAVHVAVQNHVRNQSIFANRNAIYGLTRAR
jgi:hypothetical protein